MRELIAVPLRALSLGCGKITDTIKHLLSLDTLEELRLRDMRDTHLTSLRNANLRVFFLQNCTVNVEIV